MATEKARQLTPSEFESQLIDLEGSAENANILIYGDPGCGKTRLTASFPSGSRVLYLAGEPGYISAARGGGTGKVMIIPDTSTAIAAVSYLEDGGYTKYDWIVPDGLSTMNSKFLLGYAAEAFDINPAKRAHRNLPDKPDYFNTQNFMKGWISRLVDLPVNVLFTAHAHQGDNTEGEPVTRPGIQGKEGEVSNFISGLMHIVGYMSNMVPKTGPQKGNQVRRIYWQSVVHPETGVRYVAKDQYDALGVFTDDIQMTEVMEAIGLPMPTSLATYNSKKTTRRRATA